MHKYFIFTLSLITSMAFFCCSSDADAKKPRLERIAKAYCDCIAASKLQELNEKATKGENLTEDEALALFEKLEKEFNTVNECSSSITANLGKVAQNEMDSLKLKLPQNCPSVARDMEIMRELLGE